MDAATVFDRVLPQFFPAHWLEPPGMLFRDFPSRVRIGYVLRVEGGYSFLTDTEFSDASLSISKLHQAALANLSRLPGADISIGKVPGGSEGWIHATDDNFAAARILLPSVQRTFCEELGDEFLVALSHRDDCFCWSKNQSAERQAKHAHEAKERFMEEEYNLTPDVYKFSNGVFRLHLEQSPSDDGNRPGGR